MNYERVLQRALRQFRLDKNGCHGKPHWMRVLYHGMRIADENPQVDREVVTLFAMLHDSQRETECGADTKHGARAAAYADKLRKSRAISLDREQMAKLRMACDLHSDGAVSSDPTIQACWDADRLDLGRVGTYPRIEFLGSGYAKSEEVRLSAWNLSQRDDTITQERTIRDALGGAWASQRATSPARSPTPPRQRRGKPSRKSGSGDRSSSSRTAATSATTADAGT